MTFNKNLDTVTFWEPTDSSKFVLKGRVKNEETRSDLESFLYEKCYDFI